VVVKKVPRDGNGEEKKNESRRGGWEKGPHTGNGEKGNTGGSRRACQKRGISEIEKILSLGHKEGEGGRREKVKLGKQGGAQLKKREKRFGQSGKKNRAPVNDRTWGKSQEKRCRNAEGKNGRENFPSKSW